MKRCIESAIYSFCITILIGAVVYALMPNRLDSKEVEEQIRDIPYVTTEDDLLYSHDAVQMKIMATKDYIEYANRSTTGGANASP
jgi:hypothetical protein